MTEPGDVIGRSLELVQAGRVQALRWAGRVLGRLEEPKLWSPHEEPAVAVWGDRRWSLVSFWSYPFSSRLTGWPSDWRGSFRSP